MAENDIYLCPTEGCDRNLTDQNQHNRKRHIDSCTKKYEEKKAKVKCNTIEIYFQKPEQYLSTENENTFITVKNTFSSTNSEVDINFSDTNMNLVRIVNSEDISMDVENMKTRSQR